ncbi:response regulator [candidate division WOR-3 bacterium]|nr:response regulator [candidate division WOR-3 bacterium]
MTEQPINCSQPSQPYKPRILIAEDEIIVAKDIELALQKRGYEIAGTVTTGKKAIQYAEKTNPDLLLFDIKLQDGMDGIEAVRRILKHRDIPVIFLTAYITDTISQRAKEINPYAFIIKPFSVEELHSNIEIALSKHHMHKVLQENEKRFEILFKYAPDAYYISDLHGTFIDGNIEAERLTGYKKKELIGKNFLKLKLLPKSQLYKAASLLAQNLHGKATGPDEFTVIKKDSTKVPVEIRTYPIKLAGEIHVLGIARDISEREKNDHEREQLLNAMRERIKELTCLYGIINSARTRKSLDDIFKDTAFIVPKGFTDPENARVRITFDSTVFQLHPFKETNWKIHYPIEINGQKRGAIEVYYINKHPDLGNQPFLREEQQLLKNITRLITEFIIRKQTEDTVNRLASIPEHDPNPIIETSIEGKVTYINPAAQIQFPGIIEQGQNHPLLEDIVTVAGKLKKSQNAVVTREIECDLKVFEQKINFLPGHNLLRTFTYEITEQKRREGELRNLSLLDQLTGLYNRRGFLMLAKQQIELAERSKKGLYFLYADLDRMKWINDNLGHHDGDLALKTVAMICKKTFRKSDIVGRIGGDEFAICAIAAQKDGIKQLTLRIKENLSKYNKSHKENFTLSLSIGAAYYDPDSPDTIETLLERADKLMYEQKYKKYDQQRPAAIPTILSYGIVDIHNRLSIEVINALIIENDPDYRSRFATMFENEQSWGMKITFTHTLNEGLKVVRQGKIDVVLMDLLLPDCTGMEAMKQVHSSTPDVPIILISSNKEEDIAVKAIRDGAQDCIMKDETRGSIIMRSIKYAMERKYFELELKNSFGKFLRVFEETINTLASIAEIRDPYTAGHQKRVSSLAQAIAEKMGLTSDQQKAIKLAALIHDIGKTNIPEGILNKPQTLSEDEKRIIETHPGAGYEILKTIKFPWLITQIVHQHHERLNGSGYPKGLKGNDILFESKILAVADVVEAMMSDRPYRAALGKNEVLTEIQKNKGILYDPAVVDTCIALLESNSWIRK